MRLTQSDRKWRSVDSTFQRSVLSLGFSPSVRKDVQCRESPLHRNKTDYTVHTATQHTHTHTGKLKIDAWKRGKAWANSVSHNESGAVQAPSSDYQLDAADLLSINLILKPTEDLKDAERQNLLALKEKNAVEPLREIKLKQRKEKRNEGMKSFTLTKCFQISVRWNLQESAVPFHFRPNVWN